MTKMLSRMGNRCVLVAHLFRVWPMYKLDKIGKRVTDASIMIRGGEWEDGKWLKTPGMRIMVAAWNEQAEVLAGCKKGDLVRVEGFLKTQHYVGDKGEVLTGLSLRASNVRRLEGATLDPLEEQEAASFDV